MAYLLVRGTFAPPSIQTGMSNLCFISDNCPLQHPVIGMVNHKELVCAEELVADDKRKDRVVAGPAICILL
jgi:hypothetical protein